MSRSLVTVRVLYFGAARSAVRVAEDRFSLAVGSTVGDLLAAVFERHGHGLREAVLGPDGALVPNAVVVLDGRNIEHLGGMDTPVERDGAAHVLLMASAVGGG